MDMDTLKASADDACWDNDSTIASYRLPLPARGIFLYKLRVKRLLQGIPSDQIGQVGHYKTATSPDSHIACFKHAVDFLVPDGTAVIAMREGVIEEIHDDSHSFGDGPQFRNQLNYLTISHTNLETSQYCHLLKNSVKKLGLKVGDQVKEGQLIGRVGKTGWTDRDHLHVIVFTPNAKLPFGFKSLKIRWRNH